MEVGHEQNYERQVVSLIENGKIFAKTQMLKTACNVQELGNKPVGPHSKVLGWAMLEAEAGKVH